MRTPNVLAVLVRAEIEHARRWQYEVGSVAQVSEKHISQMLNGRCGMSVEMAERLLNALGRTLVLATAPLTGTPGGAA